jgi:hypothetical protein
MSNDDLSPCPQCGHPNLHGISTCARCGVALNTKPPVVRAPVSGLAIAAAVLAGLSLLCLLLPGDAKLVIGLFAALAFLVGLIAIIRIAVSGSRVRGLGWAAVGAFLPLPFFLAAMLYPVFSRARESARKTQCLANVKNMAMAVQIYAYDYDVLPAADAWQDDLGEYTKSPAVYTCPDAPGRRSAFAYNAALDRLPVPKLPDPAATLIIFESDHGWNAAGGPELLTPKPRHLRGDNIGFPDGHAKWFTRERLSAAAASGGKLWEP